MKFLWPELIVAIGFLCVLLLSLQRGEGKTYKGFVVGFTMVFLTIAIGIKMSMPVFDKGQWVKITSLQEGLVAILKSEIKDQDIPSMNPDVVAFRPLRVFRGRGPV